MIRHRVKSIMQQVFELDPIPDDISQKNCNNWDSLRHLALIVAIETNFKISLEPDEIERGISLDEIVKLIENKQ